MARTKRIIRVRRDGELISESPRPKREKRVLPKVASQKAVPNKGVNKARPQRKHLTKAQWEKWGDNLHVLRQYEYTNASLLSLNESNDAIRSIQRCSELRFIAQ